MLAVTPYRIDGGRAFVELTFGNGVLRRACEFSGPSSSDETPNWKELHDGCVAQW